MSTLCCEWIIAVFLMPNMSWNAREPSLYKATDSEWHSAGHHYFCIIFLTLYVFHFALGTSHPSLTDASLYMNIEEPPLYKSTNSEQHSAGHHYFHIIFLTLYVFHFVLGTSHPSLTDANLYMNIEEPSLYKSTDSEHSLV